MSNGKISVVVGGQFGSEAKGAVAGFLASAENNLCHRVVAVRVAGPNAGHTIYGRCPDPCDVSPEEHLNTPDAFNRQQRHPWKLRQVPVAAVTDEAATLVIAAGSEIDPAVLADEVHRLISAGYDPIRRLYVDHSATVLEPYHIAAEIDQQLNRRIGSTAKGIGEARVARLRREARTFGQFLDQEPDHPLSRVTTIDTARYLNERVRSDHVIIEGTQGYALGLHTDNYPQVTSSDCRAVDFLAMAGVNPWLVSPERLNIWVVLRTFPIRVAGNSGPMNGETSWEDLGLPPERTTVTNKVRRVGTWDPDLAAEAVRVNGGGPDGSGCVRVALTMADYLVQGVSGLTQYTLHELDSDDLGRMVQLLDQVEKDTGVRPSLVGTSPTTIIDLRERVALL